MDSFHIISDGILEVNYGGQKLSPSSFPSIVKLGINCLLIQKNNKNILIDSGTGLFNPDENKYKIDYPRKLISEMKIIGLNPADIDIVILTHFHFDHCGGCMSDNYKPVFRNATHYIQQEEIEYSNKNSEFSKYALPFFDTLDKCGLLEVINGNTSVGNLISLVKAPGHTTGFQYVKFMLNEQNYVFPGDIIPTLWHINNENIVGIDLNPETLNTAKKEIIEDCIVNDAIMIFQHSLKPTMGKLVKKGKRIGFKKNPN